MISDGGDNASKHKLPEILNKAESSPALIYTIGIFADNDPDKNPDVLKRLATVSGGEFYQLPRLEEIVPTCQKIAKDIRTRYTIGYIPADAGKLIRHIKVTASSPDHPKLIVHTRTSYKMEDDTADRSKGNDTK